MNGALAAFDVELPEMVRARMPSMPAKMLFDFAVYLTVAVRPILMLAESVTVMMSLETSAPLSDAACVIGRASCMEIEWHYVYILVVTVLLKKKTAYEMSISDWSSDVCSSDLRDRAADRSR